MDATPPKRSRVFSSVRAFVMATCLVAAIVVSVLAIQNQPKSRNSTISLPAESEIQAVSAQLFRSPLLGTTPVAEYTVPAKYVPLILSALTPAKRTQFLCTDESRYGQITLMTNAGGTIVVTLYEGGDNPTCFAIDGVNYVRSGTYAPNYLYGKNLTDDHYLDESCWLMQIIKAINQERITGSSDLPALVEEMQRSHGERPPRHD
jgi:hypothetical protein